MLCGKIKSVSADDSFSQYKVEVRYGEKSLEECMRRVIRRLLINATEEKAFEEEKGDL